jgi:hypothetical protein
MTTDSETDQQGAAANSLTSSLADLARQQGLTELGYLLEMTRLEAESVVSRIRAGGAEDAGPPAPPEVPE